MWYRIMINRFREVEIPFKTVNLMQFGLALNLHEHKGISNQISKWHKILIRCKIVENKK